jgi:hypothetical protein
VRPPYDGRMCRLLVLALVIAGCGSSPGPGSGADAGASSARSHDLGACKIFPASTGSRDAYSYWNLDVTNAQVDPLSDQYIASMGGASGTKVHPDFGSDPTYGIPFDTVPGTQPKVTMNFDTADESDPGPYPFPADAPVEADTDGHVLVIDRDHCVLYETGNSMCDAASGTWSGYAGAVFDLKTGAPLRPEKWTSADASGGPIFVGLARYEEVSAGTIAHALRFTANRSQKAYIHPATHYASSDTTAGVPPMGLRLRLKASACPGLLSGAGTTHPQSKVIVQALCTYGMILTDNGSDFYISGATDPRWNDDDLEYLKTVPGADFEAIETGPLTTH